MQNKVVPSAPARIRYVKMQRHGKREDTTLLLASVACWLEAEDGACATRALKSGSSSGDQNGGTPQDVLLLKEMDETNNWARIGFQLYFGVFTLLLTVNVLSAGWLFTRTGGIAPFTFLLFLVFIALNLMGTIMTYRMRREMLDSDDRIADIIYSLTPRVDTEDDNSRPVSPMPRGAFNIAFFFAGATSFLLLIFWTVLLVWGFTAGFSSLVAGNP
jgi:hypothetical protein